ncbi:uncharacterized protein LOC135696156 [Rhopilema esculentum]|uniref:uncharacterized protein LOC135696156 n=1 Tax=Rhopilema esculentum TaxID=499914 RepID=UPI0031DE5131
MANNQKRSNRFAYQKEKTAYLRTCRRKSIQFQKWVDDGKKFVPPVLFMYLQGNKLTFSGHPMLVGAFRESITLIKKIVCEALASKTISEVLPSIRRKKHRKKSKFEEQEIISHRTKGTSSIPSEKGRVA